MKKASADFLLSSDPAQGYLKRTIMENMSSFTYKIYNRCLSDIFDVGANVPEEAYRWNFGGCTVDVYASWREIASHGPADYARISRDGAWMAFRGERMKRSLSYLGPEFKLPANAPEVCMKGMFDSVSADFNRLEDEIDDPYKLVDHLRATAEILPQAERDALHEIFVPRQG